MSSLLDSYATMLGESVTWKQKGEVNQYNEPTYTDSTITVIWFDDERWVKTPSGESFQQIAYIQTTSLIEILVLKPSGAIAKWPAERANPSDELWKELELTVSHTDIIYVTDGADLNEIGTYRIQAHVKWEGDSKELHGRIRKFKVREPLPEVV